MTDVEKSGKQLPKEMQTVDSSFADLGGLGTQSVTSKDVDTPRLPMLRRIPGTIRIERRNLKPIISTLKSQRARARRVSDHCNCQ